MIITRAPLRVELLGGSTDIKNFYSKNIGRVLNFTINKYIYVTINKSFDNKYRFINIKGVDETDSIDGIQNIYVRTVLKYFKIKTPLEIISLSDIHLDGTGLGSSSSFVVALISGIKKLMKLNLKKREIAELACKIEIDLMKCPIGKQDQYASVYGGLTYYKFDKNGYVTVKKINNLDYDIKKLRKHIMIFYTGYSRSSSGLLKNQNENIDANRTHLADMSDLVISGMHAIQKNNFIKLADVLYSEWSIKKNLMGGVVNKDIDEMYNLAVSSGAWGGRVSGAGGGGFMILIVKPNLHNHIRTVLANYKELDFEILDKGAEILLY